MIPIVHSAPIRTMDALLVRLHKIHEAVTGVAVVTAVRLETELTVHEDHGVSLF